MPHTVILFARPTIRPRRRPRMWEHMNTAASGESQPCSSNQRWKPSGERPASNQLRVTIYFLSITQAPTHTYAITNNHKSPKCHHAHKHTHTHARTTSPHTLTHKGADHRALRFSTPIVGCAAFVCFLLPLLCAGGGVGKRVTCSWFQLLRRQPRC